jgi:hypothetical protein
MDMGSEKPTRRRARRNPSEPSMIDLELGTIAFTAHRELEAVEMTVISPEGRGFKTWLGSDIAAVTALRFVGAVMRLISADPT